MYTTSQAHFSRSLGMAVIVLCLTVLFQTSAQADTLTVTGSSNSQNPVVGSSGQIGFLGQGFSNNFNVTATGQTFDFVFGQFQIAAPAGGGTDSGCTDGPCLPISLTGSMTTPIGVLSFTGMFEEAEFGSRSLNINWLTGSGPFAFSTPEGGQVIFTVELLDFFGNNFGTTPLLVNQMARITITGFQEGQAVPEPATIALLGTGLAWFAAKRRRKRSAE